MKIEIRQSDNSGVYENSIYDLNKGKLIHNHNNSQLTGMDRHFTDEQVLDLLGDKEYNKFMLGKFIFNVSKQDVFNITNNLDYFSPIR
jgi:hypothetical protein